MKFIPIDIVLLLDEKTNNLCKKLNETLTLINFDNAIPHTSLGMFVVKEEDLNSVFYELDIVFKDLNSFSLEFDYVKNGGTLSIIYLKKSLILLNLQKRIFASIEKFDQKDVLQENDLILNSDEEFNEITLSWVENYKNSDFDINFTPHISLGSGEVNSDFEFERVLIENIAVCHLGNYCTCKKILKEFNLKK